jgi:hypothetical protein
VGGTTTVSSVGCFLVFDESPLHCDKVGSQSWVEEGVSHESRGLKNKIGRSDKVVGQPRNLQ